MACHTHACHAARAHALQLLVVSEFDSGTALVGLQTAVLEPELLQMCSSPRQLLTQHQLAEMPLLPGGCRRCKQSAGSWPGTFGTT
jgi:hypothetical protein